MKVILFAPLMENDSYLKYQAEKKVFNPGQKFYTLLKQGLEENGCDVEVFSSLHENEKRYLGNDPHFHYIDKEGTSSNHIKYGKTALNLAKVAMEYVEPDDIIIADTEAYWPIRAALYCRKFTKRPIIGVITDFSHHVYMYGKERASDNILIQCLKFAFQYYKLNAVRKANAYVLLTENMTEVVGKKKRYEVIEGFSQAPSKSADTRPADSKKHLYYFGTLNGQSGIIRFVKCCMSLKRDDFQLHIYGDGYERQSVIDAQYEDARISYGGVVPLKKVMELEQNADFLVNPRPSKDSFNKYSFPSKTLEYMSSGTATVTTRLACIPKEYNEYLYFLDDSSEENMKESLEEILNVPDDESRKKGFQAKQYVLIEKSPRRQAEKILKLMESLK